MAVQAERQETASKAWRFLAGDSAGLEDGNDDKCPTPVLLEGDSARVERAELHHSSQEDLRPADVEASCLDPAPRFFFLSVARTTGVEFGSTKRAWFHSGWLEVECSYYF